MRFGFLIPIKLAINYKIRNIATDSQIFIFKIKKKVATDSQILFIRFKKVLPQIHRFYFQD